ncbi:MAG: hypothetical protein ACOX40_01555 [Bacilli bacterium]|jgi:hypothetical protein
MFNGSGPRNIITYEQMDSIYRQILLCLRGEISASDAASKANAESSMNFNSAKNTIRNIEDMLEGKIYTFQCGYRHTKFNVDKLIKDYPEKRDNIIKSLKLYQQKNPNKKIIDYIKTLE